MYVAARCPRCGELMLANTDYRTRSCQRCGHRADVRTLRALGRAETPADAAEMMKRLKEREGPGSGYSPGFKKIG